jgi:ABC-type Fe3+-hydroxamate transport system, periplasmic component
LNDAVKEIDSITAKVEGKAKPKVVWGSPYNGVVNVPNAGSYVGKWIDMGGGDYVFKNVGIGEANSTPLSMEEFYAGAKDADIFIYSSTVNYIANPTVEGIVKDNPIFAGIKAVKNGNVYAYSADWWETIPETDLFIKSMAGLFHPDAFKGYTPAKLVKLPKN